ncbi:MAG: CoA-transferase subunit beta [Syntrophomonadaceae bacterium]|jgi:glutaconate CoA-transferase subunit B
MSYATEFSVDELMAAIVARQFTNEDVAFIGIGLPLIAAMCAVSTHAPDAILVFEGGGIGAKSRRLPWTISDNPTTDNALGAGPMWRVFGDTQRGFVSLGVIGGAQIDKYGNLNTTVITGSDGSYLRPRVRLPGSGGANDIASSALRTVIMMRLQKGKFVNKLDFITSPGYLDGPGAREKAGLKGKGPVMVVTEKALFKFDEETKEMYLDALFPGITVDMVKGLVEWDLRVAPTLSPVEPPTVEQIKVMRAFDPLNIILGKKSGLRPETFEEYYSKMKESYESIDLKF